ncbi:MAG: hypothetical protein RJB66_1423 [Pseudomonadota bacterium]|jgi:HPt (histidine-containing phosphotransfer) domain-containing protein
MNLEKKRVNVLTVLNVFAQQTSEKAMRELVTLFLSRTPPKLEQLNKAIDDLDFLLIEQVCHHLKSNCGFLGLQSLQDLLVQLEALAIKRDATLFHQIKRDLQLQFDDYALILNDVLQIRKESSQHESNPSY